MKLSQSEVSSAVHAGLSILAPDSTVPVPAGLSTGLHHLKNLLNALGQGEYALVSTLREKPKTPMKEIEKDD